MKKVFSVLISNFILAIIFANKALAQAEFGVNDLGDAGIALGTKSIQDTIAGIINIFLGFLGILATLLILYAGFLWMTSRGNSEKIERAKLLISSAIIGLVIIVSAYAISRFILGRLYEETVVSINNNNTNNNNNNNLPTCNEPAALDDPLVCSLSNTIAPVGSGLTIRGWHFDTDSDGLPGVGRVEIGGIPAEIVECNGSPMWGDRKVKVKIPDTLAVGGPYEVILYNDLLPNGLTSIENPHFDFTVSAGISSVNIDCLVPDEGPGGVVTSVQILGNGFTDTQDTLTMIGWDTVNGAEVTLISDNNLNNDLNVTSWSDLQIDMSVPINALSSEIIVDVAGNIDQEFFDVTCTLATECTSGCCSSNSCVSEDICNGTVVIPIGNAPVIQSISPEDGEGASLVTIFGYNFGDNANPGTVTIDGVVALAPICGSTWYDNYIVVEVPGDATSVNGLLDVIVTQATAVGGESSDPYVGFDRNDIVRPGICALSATDGVYGDNIDIEGINFDTVDETYFDTVLSYQTRVVDTNNINTEVPNVVGSLGVVVQSTASIDSNALPFRALSSTDGLPIITEIAPDNGPVDAYITIRGSNFGDIQGIVRFDTADQDVAGLFDFPLLCGNTWSDNEIIVKVPAGNPAWTIGASYLIEVIRSSDGLDSNDYEFTINNNLLGPQICALSPDNGPIGTPVTISGENFGPQAGGEITFYENIIASTIASWSSNQIFNAEVPIGASTGSLILTDASSNDSNPILFEVGSCANDSQCGTGELCCPGVVGNSCLVTTSCDDILNSSFYSWDINTQAEPFDLYYSYSCSSGLQSPSPWPDGHDGIGSDGFLAPQSSIDAFVDANIVALFTRDVIDANFNTTNIQVWECDNSAAFDPTACTTQINDDDGDIEILNHNSDREGFSFDPLLPLAADTWYEVRLGTFNSVLGNDIWTQNDQWHFKTRDNNLLCEASSVAVTPQNPQSNMYPDRSKNFNASPLADNCNVCGGDYDWQWSLDHNPGPVTDYASFIGPINNVNVNRGYTRVAGGPGATQLLPLTDSTADNFITLEARNVDDDIYGYSYPIILAPDLRVESYVPNCDDSCGNAQVWVDFNTNLQGPVSANHFTLQQCDDVFCNNPGANLNSSIDFDAAVDPRRVTLDGFSQLIGGETYLVTIDQALVNIYGYELDLPFSWTFTVGDENCAMNGAEIRPDNYTAYSTNDISYKGYAMADGGSCGAQAITCETCDWDWTSTVLGVATIDTGAQNVSAHPQADGTANINLDIDGSSAGYNIVSAPNASLEIDVGVTPVVTTYINPISWTPDCTDICISPAVMITFDQVIDITTINIGDFSIVGDNVGPIPLTAITADVANTRLTLDFAGTLPTNEDFTVQIPNTFISVSGDTLNNPFTWRFGTNYEECSADQAQITPNYYEVTTAGGSTNYTADPLWDSPTCGLVPITCPSSICSYNWSLNTITPGAASITTASNIQTITVQDSIIVDTELVDVLVAVDNEDGNPVPLVPSATFDINTAGSSITPSDVDLIYFYPPSVVNICTNALPYAEFDITNGNLDRDSFRNQAIFYSNMTSANELPIDFSVNFVELTPGILTAMYQPDSLLDINSIHFVGFNDPSQLLTEDGNQVNINPTFASANTISATAMGRHFATGSDACAVHSLEIIPQYDLFTCINNTCDLDVDNGVNGNQHAYQGITYDIQKNILNPASIDYSWVSGDNLVVNPESLVSSSILATAGSNGLTYLGLEASLISDPGNVVTNSSGVEVSTCENPWPSLNTYPWEDTAGDMNFSTYYCTDNGLPGLFNNNVGIPNEVNSSNLNVLREYITTISYPIVLNEANTYFGSLAYYDEGQENKIKSWTKKLSSLFKAKKVNSQEESGVGILAFRVMRNPEHLSVVDWYNKNAPNAEQAGSVIKVDGYEAMKVGSSIYVAATNIDTNNIYTNIYIIAHNIGANATTLDIYNQMVSNFKLNTNLATSDNTCNIDNTRSCSSDFDCPAFNGLPDTCDSQGLKLRRDTKRLSDLVSINKTVLAYGDNHKACSNNSLISCQADADCPNPGTCVAYYPPLNAGSYLNGASNSRWPSWQDTFANTLNTSLPEDPINLFNGCTNPYDPSTCWDEADLEFSCPANSLLYMYNIEGVGQSYYLGAEFEYDMANPVVRFDTDLDNPVTMDLNMNSILNINDSYCADAVINAPGASTSPYCGNGIIDSGYCPEPIYTDPVPCNNALGAGSWVVIEECDNQFHNFACSESPVSANPAISTLGNQEWWNEQTIGCNPPGAIDPITNNLIECTWYRPSTPLTAQQCGGYCGDNILQPYYENCDGSLPNNDYNCAEPNVTPYCGLNYCQVLCDNGTEVYPAALCGDGIWSEGIEQCDPSANPNGTTAWDCTEGGSIGCSNTCEYTCTVGDAYEGICGDGIVNADINPNTNQAYEACDYVIYEPALPSDSSNIDTYTCNSSCETNNDFCGDGVLQYQYQELCDYGADAYTTPTPLFSDEYNQYLCRKQSDGIYTALNTFEYEACTATLDGYCGDGYIQDGITIHGDDNDGECPGGICRFYGEECDPGSPWDGIPQSLPAGWPTGISAEYQYLCDVDCVGTIGGYCGDGKADLPYEDCDGADYPGRPIPYDSYDTNTYTCEDDCSGGNVVDGGYCGDGIVNNIYYESCDDASFSSPWPLGTSINDLANNFSSLNKQYLCSSCINFGGFCGNGIIDGSCAGALCTGWQCNVDGNFDLRVNSEADCSYIDVNTNSNAIWLPTTSVGCSEFECIEQGGIFAAYEQCDTGFSPKSVIDKNVDIVYVFDTSGGMSSYAADLCQSTATVVNTLEQDHPNIDFRITIFSMGDGDSSDGGLAISSSNTADDIQQLFKDGGIWITNLNDPNEDGDNSDAIINPYTQQVATHDWLYDRVFNALYSDCSQLVDPSTGETLSSNVRYLSLYDQENNDINGLVSVTAGDGPVNESCAPYDATENWGYAMKRVIEGYNWLPGYSRIIVPVSNENAVCGNGSFIDNDGPDGIPSSEGSLDDDGIDDNGDFGLLPNENFNAFDYCVGPGIYYDNQIDCESAGGNWIDETDESIYDILKDVVALAKVNISNPVYINPVLLSGQNSVIIGEGLASATGGLFTNSTIGWETQTIQVINSTFCDAAGGSDPNLPYGGPDGSMDCRADGSWVPNQPPPPPPPPPTIINTLLAPSALAGDSFIYNVIASPDPQTVSTVFYEIGLPAGLSINSNTGVISGSTTALGTHSIQLWAGNAGGMGNSITIDLTVNQQVPTIDSAFTDTVERDTSFSYTITSSPAGDSYSTSPLPAGLLLSDPIAGIISGTPTVSGIYNILISSTNVSGTGTATLTLTVSDPLPPLPVFISSSAESILNGSSFSYMIFAINNPTSYDATNLPAGLVLNNNIISGTPTVGVGVYNITLSATNAGGTATQNLELTINACATLNQSCSLLPCCTGVICSLGTCSIIAQDQNQL